MKLKRAYIIDPKVMNHITPRRDQEQQFHSYLCKCAHMYFSVFSIIFYDQCALFLKIDKNTYAFRKLKVIEGTKTKTAVVFLIN